MPNLSEREKALLLRAGLEGQIIGRECSFEKVTQQREQVITNVRFAIGAVVSSDDGTLYLTPTTPIKTPYLGVITHFRFEGTGEWEALGDVKSRGSMKF